MTKSSKKSKKKTKKKKYIGKGEFIFNLISILFMLGIGLYFGYRSIYYYSLENNKKKSNENVLSYIVLNNNKVIKDGDGLHQDVDGHYFKGVNVNNYIIFSNRLFRIVRINNDNSMRIVSDNYVSSFMFSDSDYQNSNIYNWLNKTENDHSGVYYDTIPSVDKYVTKMSYSINKIDNNNIVKTDETYSDYFSIVSLDDYILAGGKNSYFNNKSLFYLLGQDSDDNFLYVEEDGSMQPITSELGVGLRVSFTLKSGIISGGGDGSINNPYIVSMDDSNKIDKYVKLGEDIYRVFGDKDGVLKLSLNNSEVKHIYSNTNSVFNVNERNSVANYLNGVYYNSLGYKDYLLDTKFYTGEVSDESNYSYYNIYSDEVVCKVGLLNIFDYNSNNNINEYYYMNLTSLVGSMEYSRFSNGLLEEVDVREERVVVPVISISNDILTAGTGSLEDPFRVG